MSVTLPTPFVEFDLSYPTSLHKAVLRDNGKRWNSAFLRDLRSAVLLSGQREGILGIKGTAGILKREEEMIEHFEMAKRSSSEIKHNIVKGLEEVYYRNA